MMTSCNIRIILNYIVFVSYFNCKLPFSEKLLFRTKLQNVESKLNHCLHRDVITLRERGNSDPGNLLFLGLVRVTQQSCLYRYGVTPSNTGRGKRHEKSYPG